eukprot:TRINITY_DN3740_c0_g1_i2.p1 TRINITY_DN3740_c0_g1~~TRINITY_DN3740_c0_g1_i2.p1  ORF type:complete len:524 (+),score=98.79 TRINITY_DN3740_c0_g1_i2:31-1572(+)
MADADILRHVADVRSKAAVALAKLKAVEGSDSRTSAYREILEAVCAVPDPIPVLGGVIAVGGSQSSRAADDAAATELCTPESKTRKPPRLKREVPQDERVTPDSSTFKDATPEEKNDMPRICFDFYKYQLSKDMKESTARTYALAVKGCFEYDGKAPAVMATESYVEAVRRTYEDVAYHHNASAGLKRFADFWASRSDDSSETPEEVPKLYSLKSSQSRRSVDYETAQEVTAEDNLPEGWRVLRALGSKRILFWFSPCRRMFNSLSQVTHWLTPVPVEEEDKTESERCSKKARKLLAADGTSDGGLDSQGQVPQQSMRDIFSTSPTEAEAASTKDRTMVASVLVTFRQHIASTLERNQKTCDHYVLSVFKVFTQSGRSLEAIAQPEFIQAIANSEENRKRHNQTGAAVKAFGAFWQEVGGYSGTFAEASRDMLNKTMSVRPVMRDIQRQCGHGGVCQRWKQQCETCGTTILCSKHGKHEQEECREVFWATHSTDGKRCATLRDFMRPKTQVIT